MFLLDWFYGVLASLGLWQKEAKILFLGLDNAGKTDLLRMLKDEESKDDPADSDAENDDEAEAEDEEESADESDVKRLVQHQPTQYPTSEELSIGQIKFKAFDLGGHQIARRVWKDYYAKVDAVVYLVEIYEDWRFPEIKEELDALLEDESLATVPILILGHRNWTEISWTSLFSTDRNKVNLENSHIPHYEQIVEEILCEYMKLENLTTGKGKVNLREGVRPLEIFVCSTYTGMDYEDGFKWLSQYIK